MKIYVVIYGTFGNPEFDEYKPVVVRAANSKIAVRKVQKIFLKNLGFKVREDQLNAYEAYLTTD